MLFYTMISTPMYVYGGIYSYYLPLYRASVLVNKCRQIPTLSKHVLSSSYKT